MNRGASPAEVRSLWAAVTPPGVVCAPLDTDIDTDTVVIGAGFTGLSTALHLRKAGVQVAVIEAAVPGWGASGRNNGQVIPTLSRPDPDDIEARHGDAGARFVLLVRDCAQTLFDLVRTYGIEAEAEQAGWMQPVHTPGRMAIAERRVRQWSKRGAPVELLDGAQTRAMTGSEAWHGGFWNRSGGHVNPLALARGMARAAVNAGASLYVNTPALDYAHVDGRWHVRTRGGTVRARALVLATGTYTGEFSSTLAPQLAHEVVPVLSWQMATQPVSDAIRQTVIPGRQALSDTHGELYFARFDARQRLITGGAILLPFDRPDRLRVAIAARLQRLWPQLGPVRIDPVWNGYVGMTNDFMPRFHRLGPNAWGWVGCNGRAVGLSVALGAEFAKAVCGTPDAQLAMPFTDPAPLPLHGIARKVAPLMLIRYRHLDSREIPT